MTSPAPHRARHARAEAPECTEPASAPIDMPTQRIATVIPSAPVPPPAMTGPAGHGAGEPWVAPFPPYGGVPIPPAGLPVGHPPIGRDRTVPVIVTVMLVFAVVALIALASLIDGAAGSGSTGGTGVGVPSPSSTAERIGAWADGGGMSRTRAISDDLQAISDAASRYDTADLHSACRSLDDDIASARSYDPVPDAQVQASWSSALTHGANAATYCIAGTTSMDADLIEKSSAELDEMNQDIDDLGTRLDAITGS